MRSFQEASYKVAKKLGLTATEDRGKIFFLKTQSNPNGKQQTRHPRSLK